jgi:hypothetical protein
MRRSIYFQDGDDNIQAILGLPSWDPAPAKRGPIIKLLRERRKELE